MSLTKINTVNKTSQELYQMVHSIEEKIKQNQVTQSAKVELFLELEGTCLAIEALQANASSVSRIAKSKLQKVVDFTQAQAENEWEDLETLKEKIVDIFGDLHSQMLDDEVDEIQKEADLNKRFFGVAISGNPMVHVVNVSDQHCGGCRNGMVTVQDVMGRDFPNLMIEG